MTLYPKKGISQGRRRERNRPPGLMRGKTRKGGVGCGCLLLVLVVSAVAVAALIHPFSLRFMVNRLHYGDVIMPCDAIFVPRFAEDRDGEVYSEAFREYWAGNGKAVWIEDDRVFGFAMKDIVGRMAKERGIKEEVVKAIEVRGDDLAKASQVKDALAKHGVRKVVLVVPDYASRRFHAIYAPQEGSAGNSVLFLVKPVRVSYFEDDKWWQGDLSRSIMVREIYRFCARQFNRLVHGDKGERGTKPASHEAISTQPVRQRAAHG
jgi:hypothetical protein